MVAVSSCTLNDGDPQTTLCQKLTEHLMNTPAITWGDVSKVEGDNLQVLVKFESKDDQGVIPMNAVCVYGANQNADDEEGPLLAAKYENIPESMSINGQQVRTQDLYKSIQRVTGEAVQESAERLEQKAGEAIDKAGDVAGDAMQKAGEAIKKAGESLKK